METLLFYHLKKSYLQVLVRWVEMLGLHCSLGRSLILKNPFRFSVICNLKKHVLIICFLYLYSQNKKSNIQCIKVHYCRKACIFFFTYSTLHFTLFWSMFVISKEGKVSIVRHFPSDPLSTDVRVRIGKPREPGHQH